MGCQASLCGGPFFWNMVQHLYIHAGQAEFWQARMPRGGLHPHRFPVEEDDCAG